MGFTVVDVNMRGTGCSGGAFDFFEPLQSLDGYDVIETIARQPWVAAPQGRDDGHLLRRHQPALHRRDQPAEPGGDLAALGARQHADDALPRRHPQHRLRARLGEGAGPRRAARLADGGQAWAYKKIQDGDKICKANQALHGEAVEPAEEGPRPTTTTSRRSPTRSRRSPSSTRSTCRSSWPASGPTSRRAATARRSPRTSPAPTRSGSRSPTAPTSTRSIRRPSTAGTTSSSSTSPSRRRSPTPRVIQAAAPVIYQEAMGISGVTLPPDPIQQQPTYDGRAGGVRGAAADPGPLRQRRRRHPPRAARTRASSSPSASFPIPGTEASPGTSRPAARCATRRPPGAHADAFTWNAHATPPTDFTGDTAGGHGRPLDRDARPTTGRRTRPATRSPTSPTRWPRTRRWSAPAPCSLGPLVDPERRPPGHDQRGPARRQGDLRPERLAARQRAQARPQEEHPARARAQPAQARRQAAAAQRFVKVTIPLYYEGHAYRAGSRIRVTISAPNGDQPIWAFDQTQPEGHRRRSRSPTPRRCPRS